MLRLTLLISLLLFSREKAAFVSRTEGSEQLLAQPGEIGWELVRGRRWWPKGGGVPVAEMLWQGWELSIADEAGRASVQEESPKWPSGLGAWSPAAAAAMELAAGQAKPLNEREGLLWCSDDGRPFEFLCDKQRGKLRTACPAAGHKKRGGAQETLSSVGGGGDATSHDDMEEELSLESRLFAMSRHKFVAVSDADANESLVWESLYLGAVPLVSETQEWRSLAGIRVSAGGDVTVLKPGLPIAVVESWEGVSERSLQHVGILAMLSPWEVQALDRRFWAGLVYDMLFPWEVQALDRHFWAGLVYGEEEQDDDDEEDHLRGGGDEATRTRPYRPSFVRPRHEYGVGENGGDKDKDKDGGNDCSDTGMVWAPMMSALESAVARGVISLAGGSYLEWGSGGSTENFAALARIAVSLDHYRPWCSEVLQRRKIGCLMNEGRLELECVDTGGSNSLCFQFHSAPKEISLPLTCLRICIPTRRRCCPGQDLHHVLHNNDAPSNPNHDPQVLSLTRIA